MLTTKFNNFDMFGSPCCLVNIGPLLSITPNLCFFGKNIYPLLIIRSPTIWCQRVASQQCLSAYGILLLYDTHVPTKPQTDS